MTLDDVKIMLVRKILTMWSSLTMTGSIGVKPDPGVVKRRQRRARILISAMGERWAMHEAQRVKRLDQRGPGEPPEFLKRKP